jgi:DNA-directed RNA polymerase specialized sigma24 family protein
MFGVGRARKQLSPCREGAIAVLCAVAPAPRIAWLLDHAGYTVEEIAAITDVDQATAARRVDSAQEQIRAVLNSLAEAPSGVAA